jgi:hypothetical protein
LRYRKLLADLVDHEKARQLHGRFGGGDLLIDAVDLLHDRAGLGQRRLLGLVQLAVVVGVQRAQHVIALGGELVALLDLRGVGRIDQLEGVLQRLRAGNGNCRFGHGHAVDLGCGRRSHGHGGKGDCGSKGRLEESLGHQNAVPTLKDSVLVSSPGWLSTS